MIGFKEQFIDFAKSYNENLRRINSSSGIEILNFSFESEYSFDFSDNGFAKGDLYYHELVKGKVDENYHFNYPVMVPDSRLKYDSGIILFHGLNEKSWDKYFVWAKYMVEKTQRPVILFPIAYHMNRAPKSWSDRRLMTEISNLRKKTDQHNNSTFANAALSTRLESQPELFIYSGLQTCCDIQQLLNEIKRDENELFSKDASFDIFSYSIGAFLSQILLLANPGNLFSNTRLFLFCGGPTFDRMYGNSKYIMDLQAFKSLLSLKERRKLKQIKDNVFSTGNKTLIDTWYGLDLMMSQRRGRKMREELFKNMGARIKAVTLERDKVMPVKWIIKTLRGSKNKGNISVEVIDFPFPYTHEQPFPMGDDKIQGLVDRCFTVVFDKVVNFFNFRMNDIRSN